MELKIVKANGQLFVYAIGGYLHNRQQLLLRKYIHDEVLAGLHLHLVQS
jgi:hypothetical protein